MIDVRQFIQDNYTEYRGNADFLCTASERNTKLWDKCLELLKQEREAGGVLDIETTNIVTDEYLIAYCLSYSDKYNKEIHLNVVDKEIMINTQKNTIFILKK